ncbi:MAG: hypothetical protein MZU91_12245 [Desulfosudis oleivorans]|nr:hypothetical protein [Desulfosudis oleivorans]
MDVHAQGVWHCRAPVSFDLASSDSIRDKAHRWLGQLTSVAGASEPFKLYFLVGEPAQAEAAAGLRIGIEHPGQGIHRPRSLPRIRGRSVGAAYRGRGGCTSAGGRRALMPRCHLRGLSFHRRLGAVTLP